MKVYRLGILMILAGMLCACTVHNVQRSEPLDAKAKWAVLPVANLAEIPMAGENIESMLDNALRIRGLTDLQLDAGPGSVGGPLVLDDRQRYEQALEMARRANVRFGITGAVHEWRYKTGLDGEPAVGLTLRVIDLPTGQVLWTASGARTGWGYSNVSGTAEKLVTELLEGLVLH